VYSSESLNAKRRRKARAAPLIMESMESRHPLDPLIAAADRALRAIFAPAYASRPIPGDPPPGAHSSASPVGGGPSNVPEHTGASPGAAGTRSYTRATPDIAGTHVFTEAGVADDPAYAKAAPGAVAGSARYTQAPQAAAVSSANLSEAERRESAALMRVNHAGEVAAQALYHGQALVSRSSATRDMLLKAAHEETDHLAWCETRLKELGSRPSLLNPLWYCGSFVIGALAASTGDRTSLGFVVETERQVEGHLDEHLARLPAGDTRSRAILNVMRTDEIGHGAAAKTAGASELPAPVRVLMRHAARVMTTAAYWI
jgi:ubiquinone biosynthesis monooxygenase Coq7